MLDFDLASILIKMVVNRAGEPIPVEWRRDFYRELECEIQIADLPVIRRMLFERLA